MLIEGFVDEDKTPHITVNLIIGELGINKPVTFVVDTGSSNTAILDLDAELLGIDYDSLKKVINPMCGIGGTCETFQTKDEAVMLLTCADGDMCEEHLETIYFLRHTKGIEAEKSEVMVLPSVLGRDIITRYTLVFQEGKKVYFEK